MARDRIDPTNLVSERNSTLSLLKAGVLVIRRVAPKWLYLKVQQTRVPHAVDFLILAVSLKIAPICRKRFSVEISTPARQLAAPKVLWCLSLVASI
jgi:hypothetical protein